jgi:hypothetical protein
VDRIFVWLGDVRLFLAIIKLFEDRANALHDARTAGVKSILLVEDSIQFYSSYLPMLYTEIMNQTQALMADGVNRMQRMVRMRARPKILLASTYEQGMELYERHRENLLGVILDAFFPRGGVVDRQAGIDFARIVKERTPGLPLLIQSNSANAAIADSLGVSFLDKHSPSLLGELRKFMRDQLGFGEFVFRFPDGRLVSRAGNLSQLGWALRAVPNECLQNHLERNDLSTWLMARTEFSLAEAVQNISRNAGMTIPEKRAQLLRFACRGSSRVFRQLFRRKARIRTHRVRIARRQGARPGFRELADQHLQTGKPFPRSPHLCPAHGSARDRGF